MKCKIPCRKPWIFPFIWHRYDIGSYEVTPLAVAPMLTALGRRGLRRIAIQPLLDIEAIVLLAPQHAGEGLTLNAPHLFVKNTFLQGGIERIGFGNASGKHGVELGEVARPWLIRGDPHADRRAAAGRDLPHVKSRDLSTFTRGVDRSIPLMNHVVVEGILEIARRTLAAVQPREIGLVITKQQPIRLVEA